VAVHSKRPVTSFLDEMKDGREYESLVGVVPKDLDFRNEIRRAIHEIEAIRSRPLLIYAGNVVRPTAGQSVGIVQSDDLPFAEMVAAVPAATTAVDVLIVTPGGLAQQVSHFVSRLRPRFTDVAFILPHMAFSAGTIWALSGDSVWMDERAFLGPIDPQVPGRDGRFLPAQAILTLLRDIQTRGAKALAAGQNPDWTDLQQLKHMDPKEVGDAIASSEYSILLAAEYLEKYKFRGWTVRSNGDPVSDAGRRAQALEAAKKLCSHEIWKVHNHVISRDVAWNELRIKIDHPETVDGLHRAIRRLWALLYWMFESGLTAKIFVSEQYSIFRMSKQGAAP
jgi:hypothetical protein